MVHNMSECNVENYVERNDNNGETIIVLESNASTSRGMCSYVIQLIKFRN